MSFFKRGKPSGAALPSIPREALAQLPAIGRSVFVEHEFGIDVSHFYLPMLDAMGYPSLDTPQWQTFVERFLRDLVSGAEPGDDWGVVGAFHVARDLLGSDLSSPQYVDLTDRAIRFLHEAHVSLGVIPPFALTRWQILNNGDLTW
jgi:hypothetical protein